MILSVFDACVRIVPALDELAIEHFEVVKARKRTASTCSHSRLLFPFFWNRLCLFVSAPPAPTNTAATSPGPREVTQQVPL